MRSIGVDLHSNSLTACYLQADQAEEMKTIKLSELATFQATLQPSDQVAVGVTGKVRWWSASRWKCWSGRFVRSTTGSNS